MFAILGPLQIRPISGGKFRFLLRPFRASIRSLCRPGRAYFFFSAFFLASLNDFSPSGSNAGFHPPGVSPLPLSLPTNGSHASNRADNLFRWCVPLPSSQNRTQALTVAYLFSPCSLLTFPLRGKAVLFSKLGCPGFLDSSTTASHGSNGAGFEASLASFPYPASKTAHRASQARVWFSPPFPGALWVW